MLSIIKKIISSIALIPSLLALSFIVLAMLIIYIDLPFDVPTYLERFVITEKGDVQFILTFIIGGIFTLTIFSYTMVMNVLNRNINNYSPRLIPLLLSERHHQIILGHSAGTIIYAMIMSVVIASGSSSDSFPKFAASIGVFFAIGCVFLFIYFIHSISQSIHINHILKEIYDRTIQNYINQDSTHHKSQRVTGFEEQDSHFKVENPGYFHQPKFEELIKFCEKNDVQVNLLVIPGQFVLKGDQLFSYNSKHDELISKVSNFFAVDNEVPLDVPEIGLKHLVEVAVKAMSPAINDPGTAKAAIDYFTQLCISRSDYDYYHHEMVQISSKVSRVMLDQDDLIKYCFIEMEHYMKDDPIMSDVLKIAKARINKAK